MGQVRSLYLCPLGGAVCRPQIVLAKEEACGWGGGMGFTTQSILKHHLNSKCIIYFFCYMIEYLMLAGRSTDHSKNSEVEEIK